MYQLTAYLDGKTLVDKITHLYDSAIRKVPVRGWYGNLEFHVPFWSMIYVVLKFTTS